MADASTQSEKLEFEGFANAPRDEDGNVLDFRDVEPFRDETEEGQVREQSQKTESSLVQFRTEGTETNGSPAASVGKTPTETATGQTEQRADAPEAPESDGDDDVATEDEVLAEGRGANEA